MQLEVIGMAIAQSGAIEEKAFRTEHLRKALIYVYNESDEENRMENSLRLNNLSAVRQELEKAGIIPSSGSESALAKAVKAALAIRAKA